MNGSQTELATTAHKGDAPSISQTAAAVGGPRGFKLPNASLRESPFADTPNDAPPSGKPPLPTAKSALKYSPAAIVGGAAAVKGSRQVSWHDDLEAVREFEPSEAYLSEDDWEERRTSCCVIS